MEDRTAEHSAPGGYKAMPPGLGFIDAISPLYVNRDGVWPAYGLFVAEQHLNLIGICHGGVLMTLLDVGLSSALRSAGGSDSGVPTVSLSVDFVNAAKRGSWLEFSADTVELKRRFGFATGKVVCDGRLIATGKGVVYVPDKGFALDSRAQRAFDVTA